MSSSWKANADHWEKILYIKWAIIAYKVADI